MLVCIFNNLFTVTLKDHTVLLRNFCSLGTSDGISGNNVENAGVMNSPGQTTAGNNGK